MNNEEKLVKFLTSRDLSLSIVSALGVAWYTKEVVKIPLDSGFVDCTLEQVESLINMLRGQSLGDDVTMLQQPNLAPYPAFSVIHHLQEHLYIIPTCFEMCDTCNDIFDSWSSGRVLSDEQAEWHKEYGITLQMIKDNYGCFCGDGCELSFWDEVKVKATLKIKDREKVSNG